MTTFTTEDREQAQEGQTVAWRWRWKGTPGLHRWQVSIQEPYSWMDREIEKQRLGVIGEIE